MEKINYEKIEAVKVGVQATNIEKGTSALKTEDYNRESSGSSEIERKTPNAQEFSKEGEKYKEASQLITEVSETKPAMLSSINEVNQSNNFGSSEERLVPDAAESNKGEGTKQAEIEKSRSETVVLSLREGDSIKCSGNIQTGGSTLKVKRKRPPRRVRIALREAAILAANCGSLTIKQGDNSTNSDPSVTEEIRSEGSESLKKKPETAKIPMAIVAPLTKDNLLKSTCESSKNESSLGTTPLKNESGTAGQTTLKRKKKKSKKSKKNKTGNSSTCNTTHPGNQKKQSKKPNAQVISHRFPNILDMVIRNQKNILAMRRSCLVSPILSHLQHQALFGHQGLLPSIQGNLTGNHELPMMNQAHYSGNSGIPPLMNFNVPVQNKIKRKKPKNRVDPLRNQSVLKNEVNPTQYHEYHANPPNIQRHQGNLSGSQEYPSQFQIDLLARPSTSKIEMDSKDFYGSQEYSSSEKCKRFNDSPPDSSIDLKRPKNFNEELIPEDFELKRILIAEDFGQTSVGFEELMLIRIAMSREINKIRKGPIPKFINTHLKWFGIVVEFADKWSMDWLANTIYKLHPWPGARLRLMKIPFDEGVWKEKFEIRNYL